METPPPADSWKFIISRLPEEKNEKVLPLWVKWGGVAAAFALLLITLNFTFLETSFTEPVVNREQDWNTPVSPASKQSEAQPVIADTDEQQSDYSTSQTGDDPTPLGTTGVTSSSEAQVQVERGASQKPSSSGVSASGVAAFSEASKAQPAAADLLLAGERQTENIISNQSMLETADNPLLKNKLTIPEGTGLAQNGEEEELANNRMLMPGAGTEISASEKKKFLNRLSISSTTGAVYLNVDQGSILGEEFSGKGGGSEISLAYGVNVAYAISNKVRIRSGVSKVDFTYTTPQLDYSAIMGSGTVSSDPARMGVLLSAQGDLEQEFAFIEIPAELEFTLIDKKVGLNIIGGASALLLQENNMAMITPGFTADLGEAQNLNEFSFSANLGLGVHYKFAPRLRLNLEPVVKYQLNAFNHSGGLNSYYLGIYSGISYQF